MHQTNQVWCKSTHSLLLFISQLWQAIIMFFFYLMAPDWRWWVWTCTGVEIWSLPQLYSPLNTLVSNLLWPVGSSATSGVFKRLLVSGKLFPPLYRLHFLSNFRDMIQKHDIHLLKKGQFNLCWTSYEKNRITLTARYLRDTEWVIKSDS